MTDPQMKSYPLLPLRNMILFPRTSVVMEIGRPKSKEAINIALSRDSLIVASSQKNAEVLDPAPEEVQSVGTLALIKEAAATASGNLRVMLEGKTRVEITACVSKEPANVVSVRELVGAPVTEKEKDLLVKALVEHYEEYIRVKKVPAEVLISLATISDPGDLCDFIASHLRVGLEDKQAILECVPVRERVEKVLDIMSREIEIVSLEKRINMRVKKEIERTQKEYWLREQLKAIQKELGDTSDELSEAEEYRKKIAEAKLPKEVADKALHEVDRLEKMPSAAAEAVVVRTYLDWILSLPWTTVTEDSRDLNLAQKILDEDHYGLTEVKERILEYLAIRQLVEKPKGPILCFVGPPGVGKTSLAKSIARALGRKFVRISLGGVRDEAEIRGHRRTYVGALPGRIIQGMKNAGSKNPVFLMDEVDKMASDFRGDPAAALLEVLDPEQNCSFSDHYLEIPFDLSQVMFITTANVVHTIPRALVDRMEVINLPGYTEEEKMEIARRFLYPRELKEHGLTQDNLVIRDEAFREMIRSYTREAGVRNLERQIATICRKTAKDVVSGKSKKRLITSKSLKKYLGIPRFRREQIERENQVGVALALAVTEAGGEVMAVEVSVVKGKGNLILTGQLGDVMKESAQAALSYLRSRSRDLGLDDDFYEHNDIHVHVPEGSIPKDGPSAGITMASAIASALTGRAVRHDLAMTGEITLRGRVLPVGGVKEKVLAAHRAGIYRVVLPSQNEKDVEEIPEHIRKEVQIILVDHMDQVLENVLADAAESPVKYMPPGQEVSQQPQVMS